MTSRSEKATSGTTSNLVRTTVNLTEKTYRALEEISENNKDLSKTDAINRAIQIYAWIDDILKKGGAVYIQEEQSSELQRVKIL